MLWSNILPPLCESRSCTRAMGILSEQQGRWELLRAAEENVCSGELNLRPWLWYHGRRPSQSDYKTQVILKGVGASYAIVQQ
jgi:hypothetical protein